MSMAINLVLTLAICISLFLHKKRLGFYSICLWLSYYFLVGDGFVPQAFLNKLQVFPRVDQAKWQSKNVIILLGAGSVYWPIGNHLTSDIFGFSRINTASELYFQCRKNSSSCQILASGGDPSHHGESEASVMAHELSLLGVDQKDIVLENRSNNTFQNAQFSSAVILSGGFEKIYLVTSGIHMLRALTYFSYFNVQAQAAPSDLLIANYSFLPLAQNFMLLDASLHEILGVISYQLFNFFGMNPGSSKPGAL